MQDPATKSPETNHLHFSNHTTSRISDSYKGHGTTNYGFRAQKTAQNYANYQKRNSLPGFGAERKFTDDEDSGICSPPLWRTSPPRSPQHRQNHYRSLSPSSRAQEVARGQKELMEMKIHSHHMLWQDVEGDRPLSMIIREDHEVVDSGDFVIHSQNGLASVFKLEQEPLQI
ncbi:hypothetical protein GH714_000747 [Hevea brasiliensis]|uniref:Uncharacterized protein n=1 Tax=Hevea brasiliensis TaxID=3981 RepID=A0A6A6L6L7_HEVBR|nr:hypothetical protein GH714_000747 [Hevea brasiliensis]